MDNSANSRLVKNTVVYFFGTFISRILQFILIPVITILLSKEAYGYYDLVISSIGVLTPIITLQIAEASFRFLINENKERKKEVITNVLVFISICLSILCILIVSVNFFIIKIDYVFLIMFYYLFRIVYILFQKISRGLSKNRIFATSGVINTLVLLIVQIILLMCLEDKVKALLIGNILADIISSVYIQIKIRITQYISYKLYNYKIIKEMINFSFPLIPNSISWWMMNSVNKFIVSTMLGVGSNGIFAIANKFPTLLTTATGVFQMAWQESIILEKDSNNRDKFYTETFNNYMVFILTIVICLIPFIKIVFPYIIDEEFESAILYIPILLVSSIFSSFSAFYGSAYISSKNTKGAFWTTIIGTIINILSTYLLIGKVGLFAPALGSAVSYFVVWIIRVVTLKNELNINIAINILVLLIIYLIVTILVYYMGNISSQVVIFVIGLLIASIANRKIILGLINKIKYRRK